MIQANELRIGNLVYDGNNELTKVESIVDEAINYSLDWGNLWKDEEYYFENLQPIPTTEDHLLKLGFNKDYKKGWIGIDVKHDSGMTTDFILAEPFSMGEWQSFYAFVYDNHRFVKLEFVHQVQNLFHAMTHQEL